MSESDMARAREIERIVRARKLQQDLGTFGLVLSADDAIEYIAAALAAEREREREACAAMVVLFADEHTAARDDCMAVGNDVGALTRARQAQTASDIAAAIRARKEQ